MISMYTKQEIIIKCYRQGKSQRQMLPASKYVPFSANKDVPKSANKDAVTTQVANLAKN